MADFIASVDANLGVNGPHHHILVKPDRGPLRILAIGQVSYVRDGITQMHRGTFQVEVAFWSPLLAIPNTDLVIPRYPDQVSALLQRPEHLNPSGAARS